MLATYYSASLFWIALFVAMGVTWVLGTQAARARAALLVVLSAVVLHTAAEIKPACIAMMLAGALWAYLCCGWMAGVAESRPNLTAVACAGPTVLAWSLGRFASPDGPMSVLAFAGFSFFVVKLYTVSKDIADGSIERPAITSFVAYLLFFPCAASGPMHTFDEFGETLANPSLPTGPQTIAAVFRLLLGFAKVKIVAPLLSPMSLAAFSSWEEVGHTSPATFAAACVVYSLVLYIDFSGYSDLAISCSGLVGLRVPENFRAPYLARNIREFWQRWHISFTRVLTGYLFTPVSRSLQRRGLGPRTVTVVAYLVTFGFCGFWHGASWNMIAWGGYHALGLIAYDLTRKPPSPRTLGLRMQPALWRRVSASLLTFAFVSLGWSLFAIPFGGER